MRLRVLVGTRQLFFEFSFSLSLAISNSRSEFAGVLRCVEVGGLRRPRGVRVHPILSNPKKYTLCIGQTLKRKLRHKRLKTPNLNPMQFVRTLNSKACC